jgi:hypothetical protein
MAGRASGDPKEVCKHRQMKPRQYNITVFFSRLRSFLHYSFYVGCHPATLMSFNDTPTQMFSCLLIVSMHFVMFSMSLVPLNLISALKIEPDGIAVLLFAAFSRT